MAAGRWPEAALTATVDAPVSGEAPADAAAAWTVAAGDAALAVVSTAARCSRPPVPPATRAEGDVAGNLDAC